MTAVTAAHDNANNSEELDIVIRSDVYGKGWLRRLEELIAFKQQHDQCGISQIYA